MDAHRVIEYDTEGQVVRDISPALPFDRELVEATEELITQGASKTGAKVQPDNADPILFFGVIARIPNDQLRSWWRFAPLIEVGHPWRRGLGVITHQGYQHSRSAIVGVWFPWFGPRRPHIYTPETTHISTVRLAGNE